MRIVQNIKSFIQTQPTTLNYGIDGLFIMGAMGLVANNNSLFAVRLGANSFQLSLVHFFPNIFAVLFLLPAGLFSDSLKSKKRMIMAAMLAAAFFFLVVSTSPFVPVHTVYFFLVFTGIGAFTINGLYNIAWQAFFPEAVPEPHRNRVLTFRASATMFVSFLAPLIVGWTLNAIPSHEGKIITHQIFYVLAAVLLVGNFFHFKRIQAINPVAPKRISLPELKIAARRLVKNKPFLIFTGVILFFHMTWHVDWTMYFISQNYFLEMNEFMISLTPVVGTFAQLITLKFWSRQTAKHGPDKPLTWGILGLALNPIVVLVSTATPLSIGPFVFLALHFVATLGFANVTLNLFQSLLKVVDEEYRSFSISIYTLVIMLSNAIMPILGVTAFEALGGHLAALRITTVVVFFARILATALWILRNKKNQLTSK